MKSLWLTGAFSDKMRASRCASEHNGIALSSISDQTNHLPFASLVLAMTDDAANFQKQPDLGCYLVTERTIKHNPICDLGPDNQPGIIGIFPMGANPTIGTKASDAHWRDNHAPLALKIHKTMTHYYQLSIQHRFHGAEWNGFALCCFATEEDLRYKFFNSAEGQREIARDVAKFADPSQSPRRVVTKMSWKN